MARGYFEQRKGERLTKLLATLYDRNDNPIDLTNASAVNLLAEPKGGITEINAACAIQAPKTAGQVKGPDLALAQATDYYAVFKVTWPTDTPDYIPSGGWFVIHVEGNLE